MANTTDDGPYAAVPEDVRKLVKAFGDRVRAVGSASAAGEVPKDIVLAAGEAEHELMRILNSTFAARAEASKQTAEAYRRRDQWRTRFETVGLMYEIVRWWLAQSLKTNGKDGLDKRYISPDDHPEVCRTAEEAIDNALSRIEGGVAPDPRPPQSGK